MRAAAKVAKRKSYNQARACHRSDGSAQSDRRAERSHLTYGQTARLAKDRGDVSVGLRLGAVGVHK